MEKVVFYYIRGKQSQESFRNQTHHLYVHDVHFTACAYMSIHVLYDHDHVWADIESQSFILLIPLFLLFELFIRAKLFHPSLPYSSCPFSLTKRNTFSNPSSYPSPQLILSCPHSLLFTYSFLSFHCPHLLPLSDPLPFSSSFFPLFLWSTAPYAFSLSFFNLDFHHTLFCLFRSDCLSFYFF